jgi:hypothetical protein
MSQSNEVRVQVTDSEGNVLGAWVVDTALEDWYPDSEQVALNEHLALDALDVLLDAGEFFIDDYKPVRFSDDDPDEPTGDVAAAMADDEAKALDPDWTEL